MSDRDGSGSGWGSAFQRDDVMRAASGLAGGFITGERWGGDGSDGWERDWDGPDGTGTGQNRPGLNRTGLGRDWDGPDGTGQNGTGTGRDGSCKLERDWMDGTGQIRMGLRRDAG